MVSRISTELGHHHDNLTLDHFIILSLNLPPKKTMPTSSHLRFLPQPLATTSLIFMSGLDCAAFHIHGIVWYMVFCVWLLLLRIMFSKFIHVAEVSVILFLWPDTVSSYGYTV